MPATLQQVRKRIESGSSDPRLLAFAQVLFAKADAEFLDSFDPDSLGAMAQGGFAFLESLGNDDLRVEAYNPSFEVDGWESPHTVLRLCLADRPFVVDSVRAFLRRRGAHLVHLLHPIYSVQRDSSGGITAIAGRRREGRQEAFEMYFLEREESPERLEALARGTRRVLGDVILATRDYQAMRRRSGEAADYLRRLRRSSAQGPHRERGAELEEYAAFMDWLDDDNFVFLGYREYDIRSEAGTSYLQAAPDSGLGILSKVEESAYRQPVPLAQLPEDLRERVTGGRLFLVTKTNSESTVHRPARMDYVGVKKLSDAWQVQGELRFLGLFTSKALSAPIDEIPILRRKLVQVLELDEAIPESHDYKQIVTIFNNLPREELFWSDAAQLHRDIRTIMGLEQERGVRLTLRADPLGRGLSVMVIMPRERFNAEVRGAVQGFLADSLRARHVDYQLAIGEDEEQVRFHFFFTTDVAAEQVDVRALEHEVAELTRTWEDELRERLLARHGAAGRRLAARWQGAFDERYRADTSPAAALRDVENIERLGEAPFLVDLQSLPSAQGAGEATVLKVYHHQRRLVLSEVLPILENTGLRILEQIPYSAGLPEGERGVDVFLVQDLAGRPLDVRAARERLVEALERLLPGEAENDRLNQLVLLAGLSIRQVALLRAYGMAFGQISAVTSRRFIHDTLLAHPRLAALLVEFFRLRFDPAQEGDREAQQAAARERFFDGLAEVSSLPEDGTLRGLFDLMAATVRSNYFLDKPVISFKVASREVAAMPQPRPLFEIYVSGPGVEGVHLRGGLVARGGIRWSDRPDDFRTEILGLMKTQMTKNAVIVPVGSKGGFVLKGAARAEGEELREFVQRQYQVFIRGLLDLTDNLVSGAAVHPPGLVVYDGSDPYLVVAADKGTATFSDLANAISAEYGFWLGDAFASGGSRGYDHKAIGITARGAWECVARHFRELGVDVREQEFSVAGIGDMSGDVFGNGMLYTDRIRLLAAFNHLHIFLDPNPDPVASYAERRRLFALPRSTWRDYDPQLISAGGGVFDRGAKAIPLSSQARAMLGVESDVLSGQELIRAILRMPVDLLWNGGIGTYVKCSSETDQQVGDSTNDAVRVDADELRCKVVGEGGNLGLTQLARIEYALAGGRINTDAIDNSAGVDLSDHEVNIKILLRPAVEQGELSLQQRNRLLEEMTEEVSELVLRDNYYQSLALSLAERRSRQDPHLFLSLQEYLAERGGLDLSVEAMPSSRALLERQRAGGGWTRPELAVLMAYAKMGLYRRLLETDFPDEEGFQHYLFGYFPRVLQQRFPEAIRRHPLRREIIATQFTNTVVDILGISFVHRTLRDTAETPVEIIRAALAALEILDVESFLPRLFALDGVLPSEVQYGALDRLVQAVEGIVGWILLSDVRIDPLSGFIATYREPLGRLRRDLARLLPLAERRRFDRERRRLVKDGLDEELAAEISSFDYLPASVGIIEASNASGATVEQAAKRFFALGERLSLGWLRDALADLDTSSKWEKIAQGVLIMDLRRVQRQLTEAFIAAAREERKLDAEAFLGRFPNLLRRFDRALAEVRDEEALSLASGAVLSRLLAQAEYPPPGSAGRRNA